MRDISARLLALVLTAALAIGLGSCTGTATNGSDAGEPPLGPPLSVSDLKTFVLPLDSYQRNDRQTREIERALIRLFQDCMRRYGFDVNVPSPALPPYTGNERRYGITSEGAVRFLGYHPPPLPGDDPRGRTPRLSSAAQAVAEGSSELTKRGVPKGGCFGEARRSLEKGSNSSADPMLGELLALQSYERSRGDSRVQSGFSRWSACMRRAGHNYKSPDAATNDPAFRTAEPTAREKAVALADVRCKRHTNLVNLWATVETSYQKRYVEQHSEQLAALRHDLDIQIRNASRILARP
jgi:hypothetical protein